MKLSLSEGTVQELDALKKHWKIATAIALGIIALYVLQATVDPGWASYAAGAMAMAFVVVTALVRLSDIETWRTGPRWNTRRAGFVGAAFAAMLIACMPFGRWDPPSWVEVYLYWSVCLVWLTSPGQRPWWSLVWGLPYDADPPR